MSTALNCTGFDIINFPATSLEDEVFLAENCLPSNMRAMFIYFFMLLCLGNMLFGVFVIYKNLRKSRRLSLQQSSYWLAVVCSLARLAFFALRLASSNTFATYFLIFFPNILLILIISIFCFNWVRVVVKASSFYRTKGFQAFKYLVGSLAVTVLLMTIALPALVFPAYLNRNSIPLHNILMAAAALAISTFQLAFVVFMFVMGGKVVNLMQFDEDHILEVKQRINAFKVRILVYTLLGVVASLTFLLWAAATFKSSTGMAYSYYLVQAWWFQDILGVFAVLYSSFQKLDKEVATLDSGERRRSMSAASTLDRIPKVVVHDGAGVVDDVVILKTEAKKEKPVLTQDNIEMEDRPTKAQKMKASASKELDSELHDLSTFIQAIPEIHSKEELARDQEKGRKEKEKREKEEEKKKAKSRAKQQAIEDELRAAKELEAQEVLE